MMFNNNRWKLKKIFQSIVFVCMILFLSTSSAMEVPIYDFSIKSYSQNIHDFLPQENDDYSQSLIDADYQVTQLQQFYKHYFESGPRGLSPWSEQLVKTVLPIVKMTEKKIIEDFDNQNKAVADRHYAENFKEHDEIWLGRIKQNMDVDGLGTGEFNENNKAIAISNTFARALPDDAPDFHHASLPGQGFPFDNLQESAIWSGTPLYILSVSKDKAWSLVLTPDAYFAWVKSNDIAQVSRGFILKWQAATQKGLMAITETGTSVLDEQQQFQFKSYIGAVFPLVKQSASMTSIYIPLKNEHQQAVIKIGVVNKKSATLMPLMASKKNMVGIIKQLQNRPYGWGGAFFFNDCSQEMKSIFTPFGIWLPRNSAQQMKFASTVDLSAKSMDERLSILKAKGHPLMTIIYIGGHVMLYLGNHEDEAITYQNLWGLAPANRDKRYIVGQALLLPLLKSYPEASDVTSLADKPLFKLVYLDELVTNKPRAEYLNMMRMDQGGTL